MNFEEFKEKYFEKYPYVRDVNISGNRQDVVIEIMKANVEETFNILEEYTNWINEKIKKEKEDK